MQITDKKSAVLPKEIDAIKPAVIPDRLPVLVLPIIQTNHRSRRRERVMIAKPSARLRQRHDLNVPSPCQLRQEGYLVSQPRFHRLPSERILLPGLGIGKSQGWLVNQIIHEPLGPLQLS